MEQSSKKSFGLLLGGIGALMSVIGLLTNTFDISLGISSFVLIAVGIVFYIVGDK